MVSKSKFSGVCLLNKSNSSATEAPRDGDVGRCCGKTEIMSTLKANPNLTGIQSQRTVNKDVLKQAVRVQSFLRLNMYGDKT